MSIPIDPDPDPDLVAKFLRDAAHYPGGRSAGVVRPRTVEEVASFLRALPTGAQVLPVGAQSSLTGGATPLGDVVLSTGRLTRLEMQGDHVRAGAGVTLQAVQDLLAPRGRWFPPVPTYLGATAGGAVATCAAGAATFKYGTVREWVDGLTVVLANGDILDITRGSIVADSDVLEFATSSGSHRITLPALRMPDVPKRSAGYFVAPGMDLVDLFIGSEGTLAVIAEVVFRTAPLPAARCHVLVPVSDEDAGIRLAGDLRAASQQTWRTNDPLGIDISAIEHIDARSIAVIREDGIDKKLDITLPSGTGIVLLIEIELSREAAAADLWSQLANAREEGAADSPLRRFCALLDHHGALDDAEIALPEHRARVVAFAELREAVPAGVNRRVALAQQQIDPGIYKTAADMIVPFDRFADMMRTCRRLFEERGLDLAVWGHISDGNVHPNVIPKSADDVKKGQEAILALGDAVIAMGGCPLAEHGVGRNAIKQELLRRLYGTEGVDAMRALKHSLDPHGSLAPGVIFPAN
ncbi:MAG: FAD-binding oxidoreductase [Vicinamibacterales bacterium]